jgi:hypothetical protein
MLLGRVNCELGGEFVLGIGDAETGITDDMIFVSTPARLWNN